MERQRFRDRYRIEPVRLEGWDYAAAGWYFVTICTKDRACCLSDVEDGEVGLWKAGQIVEEEWFKTEKIRPYVRMDAFVVMPNHVHGIVGIRPDAIVETPRRGVSTALAYRRIHWDPSLGKSNRWRPNAFAPRDFTISPGSRASTITSFGPPPPWTAFGITSARTRPTGPATRTIPTGYDA